MRVEKQSAIWDFRAGASEGASVDFQKTSIVGWREGVGGVQLRAQEKTLELTEMPSG